MKYLKKLLSYNSEKHDIENHNKIYPYWKNELNMDNINKSYDNIFDMESNNIKKEDHISVLNDINYYGNYAKNIYEHKNDFTYNLEHYYYSDEIKVKLPIFAVVVDNLKKSIVIVIRGTASVDDVLTDLGSMDNVNITPDFMVPKGFLKSAQNILEKLGEFKYILEKSDYNDYEIVITGHSLGASCSALLHILLFLNHKDLIKDRKIRSILFSTPPCVNLQLWTFIRSNQINIINTVLCWDIIARLTVNNVNKSFVKILNNYVYKWVNSMSLIAEKIYIPGKYILDKI